MASRTAKQHASLDGASLAASAALSQPRTTLLVALVSLHLLPSLALRPRPPVHAAPMTKQLWQTHRMLARSRMLAARRPSASAALTMTNSPAVCRVILASAPPAVSATTLWQTMASRTAKQHASSDGASLAASAALSQPRTTLLVALASLHPLPSLASRSPSLFDR